ncbi:hypothetical protein [Streptomyces adelaidensis]|jgi:hypothetical protein|nr:hypothetical protein [Streptomyces adelaidensis]
MAQVVAVQVLVVVAGAGELRPGLGPVDLETFVLQQRLGERRDPRSE